MNKNKKKTMKKASKLFVSLGITSIILIVATYAWFIGTLQVMVTGIEIQIESKEGLTISLDGQNWANEIVVDKEKVTTDLATIYSTNTNSWVDEEDHGGMLPVSSVGKIDTAHSVLELYNKASITALKGGYRVRTNKIENYNTTENKIQESGEYVVFDIFIKNTSGDGYSVTYNADEDEGIYLINDSYAKIVLNDSNEAVGDGIQNSARIGMFNIGRVGLDASLSAIQGISCTSGGSGVDASTGLCNLGEDTTVSASGEAPRGQGITWNIYEPNDKSHVEKSSERFEKICRLKSTNASTHEIEYSNNNCGTIEDGDYAYTYAVHTPIAAEDAVNVFDGLNTYMDNVYVFNPSSPSYAYGDKKLTKMEYYKDSDIFDDNENTRHEILRLAPNSITKMRIYIWIEGQDVDNFDVATQDEEGNIQDVKIKFQFGFTKDRFAYLDEVAKTEFLEEVKEVYDASENKYEEEALLGNIINTISSDGENQLDLENEDLEYYVLLNDNGKVRYMDATDGEYSIQTTKNNAAALNVNDVIIGSINLENRPNIDPIQNISSTNANLDKSKFQNFVLSNVPTEIYFTIDGHDSGTDISSDENEPIYAWMSGTKMYVSAKESGKRIKAPVDSSALFGEHYTGYPFNNIEKMDVTYFDTSKVTDMSEMFNYAGSNVTTSFEIIGLDHWDTSKVTNMYSMFASVGGYNCESWSIGDLSNWDTSNVTNMSNMFSGISGLVGDIRKWDTSKVTDMSAMFINYGRDVTTFNLDLSNWDTSKVTNMRSMFDQVGTNSTSININLSGWDTSNVTDMSYMFFWAGINGNVDTTFHLDLSGWDTSNVTNMYRMFYDAGSEATTWDILGLDEWDTSKVTDMSYMFCGAGKKASTFSFDLSNWDTTNVTNMEALFWYAGAYSTTFNLNLSGWDTSNVTNMSYMFSWAGESATIFNLDLSGWNTSNVIANMNNIFEETGKNATTFSIKIPNRGGNTNTLLKGNGVSTPPPEGRTFTLVN